MLFARRTYDQLVGFWLSTPDPNPFADLLRDTPKYVATHRPDALAHLNSISLDGDVPERHRGDPLVRAPLTRSYVS